MTKQHVQLLAILLILLSGIPALTARATAGKLNVPSVIDGKAVTITDSGSIDHPLVIRNGGKLIFNSPSVHLASNVTMDHGTLEVHGGNFYVDPKFEHEFTFTAKNQSTMSLDGCQFASPFTTQLNVSNSKVELKHVMFASHGFTCSAEQSTVNIDDSIKPGEFIVAPASHYRINRSHGVVLWLTFGPEAKADLTLPAPGESNVNMTIPTSTALDVKITDSNWILWAMLTKPGCDITLRNSEVMACGLVFPSKTSTRISGLRDDRPNPNFKLNLSDRNVTLVNSKVKAWNFYPLQDGNIAIGGCTFGELNAFNRARVNAFNSSCDALGGYIRVSDDAKAEFTNCILNCSAVTTDRGELTLNNCTVTGDTTASGDSKIVLNGSKLVGHKQEIGHGHIVSKP